MKYLPLAIAGLILAEGVAIACSCINTDEPAELQRLATEAAQKAVAVVEARALTSFEQTPDGEQMQVTRILAGAAPSKFRVHRAGSIRPSSASCDIEYQPGDTSLIILYPAAASGGGLPAYNTSGLCSVHLLEKPVYRETLIQQIKLHTSGERG